MIVIREEEHYYTQTVNFWIWNEVPIYGGVYTKTFSGKKEYFVFVYMEAMRLLHQYISTKNIARYCNY